MCAVFTDTTSVILFHILGYLLTLLWLYLLAVCAMLTEREIDILDLAIFIRIGRGWIPLSFSTVLLTLIDFLYLVLYVVDIFVSFLWMMPVYMGCQC